MPISGSGEGYDASGSRMKVNKNRDWTGKSMDIACTQSACRKLQVGREGTGREGEEGKEGKEGKEGR